MNAIEAGAKINRARAERIVHSASHMAWQVGAALEHLRRGSPIRPLLSSSGSDFNYDYNVSFTPEDLAGGSAIYNYAANKMNMPELPGISVFFKDADGKVFHTYSCYARGLDMLNTAYHYLDLVPKGRDEAGLPHTMAWRISDEVQGDRREAGRIPEPNRRDS